MTFDDYLARLHAANPRWARDGADLTAAGLRKLLEQTYRVGRDQGRAEQPRDGFYDLVRDLAGVGKGGRP